MSSSMEKAVQTLQEKSQNCFCPENAVRFMSVKKSAHPLQANVCISRRIKGGQTPNNWVVCCCSVVYLTRGIGIFVGTSSKRWDPECPLHCVMHASTVYSANTLHPPTSLPECVSGYSASRYPLKAPFCMLWLGTANNGTIVQCPPVAGQFTFLLYTLSPELN